MTKTITALITVAVLGLAPSAALAKSSWSKPTAPATIDGAKWG